MKDYFWASYSDLMTALFFVMLVLYILTFVKLKHDQEAYRVSALKYEKLQEIEKALSTLDDNLFEFDKENKRYKLKTDARFSPNSSDISTIPELRRNELRSAGRNIYELIESLSKINENVNYLLILEGNAARANNNHINYPNEGYKLSYNRALALFNFWKDSGYDFRKLKNCEIIVAGSGHFGKSRESDEPQNKRFTIQITGKIGEFKQD